MAVGSAVNRRRIRIGIQADARPHRANRISVILGIGRQNVVCRNRGAAFNILPDGTAMLVYLTASPVVGALGIDTEFAGEPIVAAARIDAGQVAAARQNVYPSRRFLPRRAGSVVVAVLVINLLPLAIIMAISIIAHVFTFPAASLIAGTITIIVITNGASSQ